MSIYLERGKLAFVEAGTMKRPLFGQSNLLLQANNQVSGDLLANHICCYKIIYWAYPKELKPIIGTSLDRLEQLMLLP